MLIAYIATTVPVAVGLLLAGVQLSCQAVRYQGGGGEVLHVIDLYAVYHWYTGLEVNNLA